jgi:hypothetical protein
MGDAGVTHPIKRFAKKIFQRAATPLPVCIRAKMSAGRIARHASSLQNLLGMAELFTHFPLVRPEHLSGDATCLSPTIT